MSAAAKKKDEIMDVIDVRGTGGEAKSWLKEFINDLTKASTAKQVTVGGITGWCAGYLFTKVGKAAAVSVGGSLLLIQLASHKGYIKVNWGKVNHNLEHAKRKIEREAHRKLPRIVDETQRFMQDNIVLATGFAGGFLLGIASSWLVSPRPAKAIKAPVPTISTKNVNVKKDITLSDIQKHGRTVLDILQQWHK